MNCMPVRCYGSYINDCKFQNQNTEGPIAPMGLCGNLPFSIFTDIHVAYKYSIIYFNAASKRK
jgi:hypothetical protein